MILRGRAVDLSRPQLVGILNLTPDSFSDGGDLPTVAAAVARARALRDAGADLLDLGGESTRPGARPVAEDEEIARVVPAVAAIARDLDVPLAVDTRRPAIAARALDAGATMVNDTSGSAGAEMALVVRERGAAWVLMHAPDPIGAMGWSARSAALPPDPVDAIDAIARDLAAMIARAANAGVDRGQLAIDPGIGFGKDAATNFALLRRQPALATIGLPLYVGPSRKSFLARAMRDGGDPRRREFATAAAVTAAVFAGAAFVRVHDVASLREVVDVAIAIRDAGARQP